MQHVAFQEKSTYIFFSFVFLYPVFYNLVPLGASEKAFPYADRTILFLFV